MVNDIRKMKKKFDEADIAFSNEIIGISEHVEEIRSQIDEKLSLIGNIDKEILDIDEEFALKTGIVNRKDQAMLWTAVALQTIRWILLPKLKFDMPEPDIASRGAASTSEEKDILSKQLEEFEDEDIENIDNGKNDTEKPESKYIDKILYFKTPVPYDAMNGEEAKKLNLPGVKKNPDSQLSGRTHHAATLGHDPVLGYFFGTMNIMTYTITFHKFDLQTNEVILIGDTWQKEIGTRVSFFHTLLIALLSEVEDPLRVPFAVARHQIHMMTDEGTKMGLPIPFLSASKQQSLLEKGWNSAELKKIQKSFVKYRKENLTTIALQLCVSLMINIIIKSLHLLMYDESKDNSYDLYKVRTSKIIAISNVIASSINMAYVGGNVSAGIICEKAELVSDGIKNIDLGGYLEAVHQIASSKRLQEQIRREYLEKRLEEKLVGEEYSFWEVLDNE